MNTNDHQTHDLFEPTCDFCHEDMFGGWSEDDQIHTPERKAPAMNTSSLTKRFPLLNPIVNTLHGLSVDPNTIDSERYARKTRALAKSCSEAMLAREDSSEATQVRLIFVGLHRLLDWEAPVALNANLIANALEAAEIICSAASLDDCTCLEDPDLICFSEDHLI